MKEDNRCVECDSYQLNVLYKEKSPFPGSSTERSGCIICDTILRQTIVNSFTKKKKTFEEMNEEEKKQFEEKRKKKEAKKLKKEEDKKANEDKNVNTEKSKKGDKGAGKNDTATGAIEKKKKAKKGKTNAQGNMTAEELMNEFIKKQFGS